MYSISFLGTYIFLLFLFFYFVYNLHLFEQHFSTGADGWLIISDLALYSCGSYYMYVCICCCTVYLTICFVYNSKFCSKFKMNVACSGKLFRKRILSGKLLLFRKLYLLLITNIYKNTLHTLFENKFENCTCLGSIFYSTKKKKREI